MSFHRGIVGRALIFGVAVVAALSVASYAAAAPVPSGLVVTAQADTSVSLDWTSDSFASGVDSYRVYVNGEYATSSTRLASAATVTGLRCGTSYVFGVTSYSSTFDRETGQLYEEESDAAEITASTTACGPPVARFDWTMPERARDGNNDGLLDIAATPPGGWTPTSWTVRLDACASTGDAISTYRWEIEGQTPVETANCAIDVQVPEEKAYGVTLRITAAGGAQASTFKDVVVQDRLIVVMGDSYASGEGNPEKNAVHGTSDVVWADKRCHRSGHAASARAALAIERDDAKSSVTFLTLACSGGTLKEGVLGPYAGVSWYNGGVDSDEKLPPQIDAVAGVLAGRRIDDLIISIGGNDIGFVPIVSHCLFHSDCETHEDKKTEFNRNLVLLRDSTDVTDPGYPTLRNSIQLKLNVRTTYITEYPDFTTDAVGNRCSIIGEDMHPLNGMDAEEAEWAATAVLGGLNGVLLAKVNEARDTHNLDWRYVDGLVSAWSVLGQYGHGYCVGKPDYKTPIEGRWVRTFTESCDMQGPATWFFGAWACQVNQTIGTLHPNAWGQQALANRYVAFLRGNPPPVVLPDRQAPTLADPPDLTRQTDPGKPTAVVHFAVPDASDNVAVTAKACSPASGTAFAVGSTTVTCVARDAAGNEARQTFTVTVEDKEAPSVVVANVVKSTSYGGRGLAVAYTATVSDNVPSPSPTVECTPASNSMFPLGSTIVTCLGRDAGGNESTRTFTVTVTDAVKPNTTLLNGPKGTTTSRTAKFTFRSSEPIGGKFQCKLDRGAWRKCSSPKTYSSLKRGYHTFQVRAIDKAGNKDKTAAKRTWRIK